VDLDLGNYERFLDVKLTRDNNITTGKIYQASVRRPLAEFPELAVRADSETYTCLSVFAWQYVIDKERKGDYLGKTVQVVLQKESTKRFFCRSAFLTSLFVFLFLFFFSHP